MCVGLTLLSYSHLLISIPKSDRAGNRFKEDRTTMCSYSKLFRSFKECSYVPRYNLESVSTCQLYDVGNRLKQDIFYNLKESKQSFGFGPREE